MTELHSLVVPEASRGTQSPAALHHEITTLTGLYSEVCDHDGCRMGRIKNRTTTSACLPLAPLALPPATRPFALTIGPVLHHNGSMTAWSANNLLAAGEAYVELSSADAAAIGAGAGDVLKITSDTGSVSLKARPSERLQNGALFVPAHFGTTAINSLTGSASFPQFVSLAKA